MKDEKIPRKKLQVKTKIETESMSAVKTVLGMVVMLFLAASAIAGILTWYIFQ